MFKIYNEKNDSDTLFSLERDKDGINFVIVDEEGTIIFYILTLTDGGIIELCDGIDGITGLQTDKDGYIVVKHGE